ncbi:MAG: hypothetical protein IKY98_03480 [Alphaproteobacteria bacterium]|nr:hypothetical protein [Alphaproteobacteria bacterium]
MQLVLDNGLKVSVVTNHSGHLKQVATPLNSLGKEGFMVVSFLGNGCAQETGVSISDGYVSIKNYTDNRLVSEMFRDTLYQKTFYYTYDKKGQIIETQMDSQSNGQQISESVRREGLTHAPIHLFDDLRQMPQLIVRDKMWSLKMKSYEGRDRTTAA